MWHSPNAGHVPDVKFLRAAGIALAVLALGFGTVSLIGAAVSENEPRVVLAEAKTLEQGTAALFRSVDENIARRHELDFEILIHEGETR